ncbi:MAG: hypothetical protein AB1714_20995 [Acidobacteriota bacterium]
MSTSSFFKFHGVIRRLHEGPLGVHIDAYAALLQEQGYKRASACVHLQIVADLSRWMQRRELGVNDIGAETLNRYLHCRRHYIGRYRGASAAPYKILGMLRDRGIVDQEIPPVAVDESERTEADFKRYLLQERGLSAAIPHVNLPIVHRFLWERFGSGPTEFSALCGTDLTKFVQRHVHERSPRSAQHMVRALRAFMRYLRYRGKIVGDLAACVPTVANWSFSTLPKFLQPGQVQQVLVH